MERIWIQSQDEKCIGSYLGVYAETRSDCTALFGMVGEKESDMFLGKFDNAEDANRVMWAIGRHIARKTEEIYSIPKPDSYNFTRFDDIKKTV